MGYFLGPKNSIVETKMELLFIGPGIIWPKNFIDFRHFLKVRSPLGELRGKGRLSIVFIFR